MSTSQYKSTMFIINTHILNSIKFFDNIHHLDTKPTSLLYKLTWKVCSTMSQFFFSTDALISFYCSIIALLTVSQHTSFSYYFEILASNSNEHIQTCILQNKQEVRT